MKPTPFSYAEEFGALKASLLGMRFELLMEICANGQDQARMLRHYGYRGIYEGRLEGLNLALALLDSCIAEVI